MSSQAQTQHHAVDETAASLIARFRSRGVQLWSEHGQLRYRARKGALGQAELEALRDSKQRIIAVLERTSVSFNTPSLAPRPNADRAPLSFAQLQHWHAYHLNERRAIRQIATAVRLQGPLCINALRVSLAALVQHHEALRTRIETISGVPEQVIDPPRACPLQEERLEHLSESERELATQEFIKQTILEPIDIAVGPLFGVRLLRLQAEEHVFIIALEHSISDAHSLDIVLRDLFTAYAQVTEGREAELPEVSIQLADHAIWQRRSHSEWLERHAPYWERRLSGNLRLQFPEERDAIAADRVGWGSVPIKIGHEPKVALQAWCRRLRTTLVMSALTAYVAMLLRWCDATDAVIQYQTNGRTSPRLKNTVGYLASVIFLCVSPRENDSLTDLMGELTKEYCAASEHEDGSFLEAQNPRPQFARNAAFNWVPHCPSGAAPHSTLPFTFSPVPFEHPMLSTIERDNDPTLLLYDSEREITGYLMFPLNRFSYRTMEKFAERFEELIKTLPEQAQRRVTDLLPL